MLKYLFVILFFSTVSVSAQNNIIKSDWRGPNRDGIYPETGLLKQWPEKGPDLLWSFEGLGYGHSSAAVADGKVFVTGVKDTTEAVGTLFVFNDQGNLLWEKDYGKDFTANFHGTRSTPVIVDDLIYLESGVGKIHCLNTENGNEIWSVDFISDFGADSVIQFGFSESVLMDGDNLICVPGGKENNVVALNRLTGQLVWSSKGNGEIATYNSPILIERNGQRLVIAQTEASVMGIDADNGEMYWRVEQTQQNKIHANTPLYADGKLLIISSGREATSGMVMLQLSDNGREVSELWRNKKFVNLMGGAVKLDTVFYSATYMKSDWQSISWNTGEMLVQNKELGGGAILYSDGMFYCYSERDGEIALAKADSEKFEIISRFKVPLGTNEHWAHPVISGGKLYVRHGNALMVYQI